MPRTVKYTPAFAKATHEGLAIRAVDAAEMGACELQGPHPQGDKPLHYDDAIDPRTGRNWMDSPTTDSLPGTTPLYVAIASPILAAAWNLMPADTRADGRGYRPNEWYFVPGEFRAAIHRGEDVVWPNVWDASVSEDAPTPQAPKPEPHMTIQVDLRESVREAVAGAQDEIVGVVRQAIGVELHRIAESLTPKPAPDLASLVDRFLTWPVPADVHPDGIPGVEGRTGTNLLTATQAKAMLAHVLGLEA